MAPPSPVVLTEFGGGVSCSKTLSRSSSAAVAYWGCLRLSGRSVLAPGEVDDRLCGGSEPGAECWILPWWAGRFQLFEQSQEKALHVDVCLASCLLCGHLAAPMHLTWRGSIISLNGRAGGGEDSIGGGLWSAWEGGEGWVEGDPLCSLDVPV